MTGIDENLFHRNFLHVQYFYALNILSTAYYLQPQARVLPAMARKMRPVLKASTTYSSLIPLDEWLTLMQTNETCFEEGMKKLVGLGWGERRLGENILGWENKRLGEGLPAKLVERYTHRHRDVLNCHLVGVDKEKLSEDQLRKLICGLESGAKVVNAATADGEIKLCVSVLSLGPNGVRSGIIAETRGRSDKTTAEASTRGVEREVNISFG